MRKPDFIIINILISIIITAASVPSPPLATTSTATATKTTTTTTKTKATTGVRARAVLIQILHPVQRARGPASSCYFTAATNTNPARPLKLCFSTNLAPPCFWWQRNGTQQTQKNTFRQSSTPAKNRFFPPTTDQAGCGTPGRQTRADSSLWPQSTVPKLPGGTNGCQTLKKWHPKHHLFPSFLWLYVSLPPPPHPLLILTSFARWNYA